jgi:Concanavalin A-like lectin/glucanases superfamily/Bacterial Ig domain
MSNGITVAASRTTTAPRLAVRKGQHVPQPPGQGVVRLARVSVCLVASLSLIAARQVVNTESVLVSHWELDEGKGTTTIDSIDGGSGTLLNGAAWTAGHSGSAVDMDGVDDYIALPALEVTSSALTLVAWVRMSSFPSGVNQRFISKADDNNQRTYWELGHSNDGQNNRLLYSLRTGGQTTTLAASTGSLPLNTWFHAAATYDGTRMRLYLNGTEVGSIAKSGSLSRGTNIPVNIGRSPSGTDYLRGAIDDVRIYTSTLTQAEIAALAGSGSGSPTPPAPSNQPPTVSLIAPKSGAVFDAPATIAFEATASDPDGSIARVDFYSGEKMIGTAATSPYRFQWTNVGLGTYEIRAAARDNAGATTFSSTLDITVKSPDLPDTAIFTPSSNHATAVEHYLLEIFPAGADPTVANPVASRDLGKPAITNGECRVDITTTIQGLSAGNYIATITAIGSGGSTQSAPSPQFTR